MTTVITRSKPEGWKKGEQGLVMGNTSFWVQVNMVIAHTPPPPNRLIYGLVKPRCMLCTQLEKKTPLGWLLSLDLASQSNMEENKQHLIASAFREKSRAEMEGQGGKVRGLV